MGSAKKLLYLSTAVVIVAFLWHWTSYIDVEDFYAGKRVVLTGASRGIGKSLAIQLAQLGAKLVIGGRSEARLKETRDLCLQHTPHVEIVVGDVSDEGTCKEMVDRAVEKFGGLDVLLLNAAFSPTPGWFADMAEPAKKFADVFGVNLLQSVHLVHHALPHLNRSRGIIVPVSSGSAVAAIAKVSAYATSKHALHGFFKVLNQEFIMTNTPISITIMVVPSVLTDTMVQNWKPIDTGDGITPEACADIMIRGIPQRRMFYYVDWTLWILGKMYSLCPEFVDAFARNHIKRTSNLFS